MSDFSLSWFVEAEKNKNAISFDLKVVSLLYYNMNREIIPDLGCMIIKWCFINELLFLNTISVQNLY